MPERYHIHTAPTRAKFPRVGKYGTADWREDCARCKNCVKHRCLYDVYDSESAYSRDATKPLQPVFECKACLSCVQGCTKGLLSLTMNPAFLALGDPYWRPDILATTWDQAETGKIPVSGAGYRGPFSGPGFDSMWTDMSEIVRPTRDGIHGREYISTSVDIGPRPMRLNFDAQGAVTEQAAPIEVQMPIILDAAPWGDPSEAIVRARVSAAAALKTLAIVPARYLRAVPEEKRRFVVPLLDTPLPQGGMSELAGVRMAEIADGPASSETAAALQAHGLLAAVRVTLRPDSAQRVIELHKANVSVIHLCANSHGREMGAEHPRFVKEALREVHGALVAAGVRDQVTLIGSGGIALAEHMAKAVICGADLVGIDVPLLVALGCRVCPLGIADCGLRIERDGSEASPSARGSSQSEIRNPKSAIPSACPAAIPTVDVLYATQRMVNLMGAWHSQLIEVLGAMGIREVRRLRGEVGRAMFIEDLERDAFKDIPRSVGSVGSV